MRANIKIREHGPLPNSKENSLITQVVAVDYFLARAADQFSTVSSL
jgi:hypothetical protein